MGRGYVATRPNLILPPGAESEVAHKWATRVGHLIPPRLWDPQALHVATRGALLNQKWPTSGPVGSTNPCRPLWGSPPLTAGGRIRSRVAT